MVKRDPRHLLHVFPTFAIGGSQVRFGQLVTLHGDRYRHTVISLDGEKAMASLLPKGVPVVCENYSARRRSLFAGVRDAVGRLDHIRPDALVTYNWGSMYWWLAKRLRRSLPHIHIEDGFGPDERDKQLRRRVVLRRHALADAATVTVLPSMTLLNIARTQWLLPPGRLGYIPNGIEWQRFTNDGERRGALDKVVIGTIATLRPEKNLVRLVQLFNRAASRRPDVRMELLIVGDGSEFDTLQKAAAQSPFSDRIKMAGATREPEKFLAIMDIFALSSDTEQMPLSVLEAMASSLPIVSFDVGDVAQMVGPENRMAASIPRDNDEGFIKSLLEFVDNSPNRAFVGEANLLNVKSRFDVTAMAEAYAALFG